MRTRAGVTAAVAVLSLLGSAAGHAFVSGHPVAAAALPQLGLLAAICFLLGCQRLGTATLVAALSLVQTAVHLVLATTEAAVDAPAAATQPAGAAVVHDGHSMAGHHMPGMAMADPAGTAPAGDGGVDLTMLVMHLGAMLATLWLLGAANRWWDRLGDALANVLPALPRLVPVAAGSRGLSSYAVLPVPRPQRWLPDGVLRRGPPER